uniref:hypothetical protein n=1 Tax=Alistipes putredinis TaxID=28117 RepID=UPI003FD85856
HVLLRFTLVLNCNTKISEKSDMQNPEQLFVAQELINKVKSKCCGIKVEYGYLLMKQLISIFARNFLFQTQFLN